MSNSNAARTPQSGENGAHYVAATATPTPPSEWSVAKVGALVGMIGVVAGGLGSLGASSFARGESAKRLDVVEEAIKAHGIVLERHNAQAERLAVVEANVSSIKEGVARIEQAMRDDRAERRNSNGGPR